jgi:ATP-binding cassette, subfamily B, bacterial MsbA
VTTGGSIARLLHLLRPYPWLLPVLVSLGIAASLAEAVGIGLLIPLLGLLLQPGDPETLSGIERTIRSAMMDPSGDVRYALVAGLILILITLKTLLLAAYAFVASSMTGRIAMDMRLALWDRISNAEMAWFLRSDQGRLLNIVENQTYRATQALSSLTNLIVSLCTLIVFGGFLILLSTPMAIVVFAAGMPIFFLVRRLTFLSKHFGTQLGLAYSRLAGRVMELLTAMKTIRVFNQQASETNRFAVAANQLRLAFLRAEVLRRLLGPVLELIYLPVFFAVVGFALYQGVSVPVMLTFLLLLYRMLAPLKIVDAARVALAEYTPALDDVDWLLETAPDERKRAGGRKSKGLQKSLVLEDVRFSYPGADVPVLRGVSAEFKKGEIVALVGPSGSGKSTLVSLLFGLYVADSGKILVDGEPLEELDLYSWREHIAFAGQDSDLVSGSARHNIAYGAPEATAEAVEMAARSAHAHEFLGDFPGQYETDVGVRGVLLSGGQRQRIALARALLRTPDLLVLDEATNAVDSATELAIQSAISELAGRATILIIAHRTSTLMNADRVLVMEKGQIVEDTSPDRMSLQAALFAGVRPDVDVNEREI